MRPIYLIRAVIGVVLCVCFTALMSVLVVTVAVLGREDFADRLAVVWGRTCLLFFNVKVQLHGVENIPMDRGVLFLFNHQSHFDIPCLYGYVPKRMRFGAKYELFKIPIFGRAMRAIGTLPIARENRNEVFRVYREAEAKFAMNWNYALAPEGTRQPTPAIGSFKKGPFIFAVNAQAIIVPIVISGTYEVLPKGAVLPNADRWSRVVHMRFLPAVETRGMTISDVSALATATQRDVVSAFAEMRRL